MEWPVRPKGKYCRELVYIKCEKYVVVKLIIPHGFFVCFVCTEFKWHLWLTVDHETFNIISHVLFWLSELRRYESSNKQVSIINWTAIILIPYVFIKFVHLNKISSLNTAVAYWEIFHRGHFCCLWSVLQLESIRNFSVNRSKDQI